MVNYQTKPGYRGPQTEANGKQPTGFPMGQPSKPVNTSMASAPSPFQAPSGYTRVSPGMYRGPDKKLYQQSQISGKFAEPLVPPAAEAPPTVAKPKPKTPPLVTNPQLPQQALMGTYTLPTEDEMRGMFQQRYEQELADITTGVGERQAREQAAREQMLYDRGISPDSEAYRNEIRALAESKALEAAQARSQARQFAEGATAQEFSRRIQGVQAAQEQQKISAAQRQYQQTFGLEQKRILAGIENDRNLTKIQKAQLKEMARSNMANEALKLQAINAQAKGDVDAAQRYTDQIEMARNARYAYLTRQPDAAAGIAGLGLTPEQAREILLREERGGPSGLRYSMKGA